MTSYLVGETEVAQSETVAVDVVRNVLVGKGREGYVDLNAATCRHHLSTNTSC